ncbi:MAG: hypothetical protein VYD19_00790, partial [Myxococcota bacterium]|nr:hypothetical protein [Myxococcota bacterium]
VPELPPICSVDPCASERCDQSMISCPEEPAPGLPAVDTPLVPDRSFECQLDSVNDLVPVGSVAGEEGSFLALHPADRACNFHIVYQKEGAEKVRLTERPGGYLFLAGRRINPEEMVVCASNISHQEESPGSSQRRIERVTIDCFHQRDGRWGPAVPIIIPDGPWAAWLQVSSFGIPPEGENEASGRFSFRYGRDFSFQFMNTVDAGRPTSDGYYLITLDLEAALLTAAEAPRRLGSIAEGSALAADAGEPEPWDPSEEEIEAFEAELEQLLEPEDGDTP